MSSDCRTCLCVRAEPAIQPGGRAESLANDTITRSSARPPRYAKRPPATRLEGTESTASLSERRCRTGP